MVPLAIPECGEMVDRGKQLQNGGGIAATSTELLHRENMNVSLNETDRRLQEFLRGSDTDATPTAERSVYPSLLPRQWNSVVVVLESSLQT